MEKKKRGFIIAGIVVIVGICAFFYWQSTRSLAPGYSHKVKTPQIEADSIVMAYEDSEKNKDVLSSETEIIEEDKVRQLVELFNSLKIERVSRPLAGKRILLKFYKSGELVREWRVNKELVGSTDEIGNCTIESEFDYEELESYLVDSNRTNTN